MLQMWEFAAYPLLALMFVGILDRKSTRLNSSHLVISYAVFCLKKKNNDGYMSIRDMDNLSPIGTGRRWVIFSAPQTVNIILLQTLANLIIETHRTLYLIVLPMG